MRIFFDLFVCFIIGRYEVCCVRIFHRAQFGYGFLKISSVWYDIACSVHPIETISIVQPLPVGFDVHAECWFGGKNWWTHHYSSWLQTSLKFSQLLASLFITPFSFFRFSTYFFFPFVINYFTCSVLSSLLWCFCVLMSKLRLLRDPLYLWTQVSAPGMTQWQHQKVLLFRQYSDCLRLWKGLM